MYNPFKKPISEIRYEDLKKLIENNISEGWYVEYKGSFPKNNKIANSIASFANSNGGWYIVGIEENENESKPSQIKGFNLNTNKKSADKISNIVKENIDPIPYFESKIVEVPENKVVLVVQVFEGYDVPYISNGSVYIRIGETSKCLPIDNRYQFEKLLDKKYNFQENVNSFMNNKFFINKNFTQPYLEFYIYVNNPKNYLFENFHSEDFFEKVKNIFNSDIEIEDNFPVSIRFNFDNIYASIDSYILRHINNNSPLHTGLTLELFRKGHLKLIFPFNIYNYHSLNSRYKTLTSYKSFFNEEYKNLRIIDLIESTFSFQIILAQYKKLLKEFNCEYELLIKCKFKNFNLITPFIDSEEYMNYISENQLPINLKNSINIPDKEYITCPFREFDVISLINLIIPSTGIPKHLSEAIVNGYKNYFKYIFNNKL